MKTKSSIKNHVLLALLLAFVSALFVSAPKLAKADTGQWEDDGVGTRYIYDEAGDYYTNCWQFIDGNRFYFGSDGYVYKNGWAQIGSHWYYFWGAGAMGVGWIWDNYYGSWFYCDPSTGAMYQGCWAWIGDAWYGFWGNGQMCQGWIWDSSYNNYFYCDFWTGAMYQGCWAWIGDAWYGFWANGEMCYGWVWDNSYNDWFYCDWWSGYMYTGWHWIDGSWYYFWSGGAMAKSCWVDDWWLAKDGRLSSGNATTEAQELIGLINSERAKYGLPAMNISAKLNDAAVFRSKDLAESPAMRTYSSRYGDLDSIIRMFGVSYKTWWGFVSNRDTAMQVFSDCMKYSALTSTKYNCFGVGCYQIESRLYWTFIAINQ